MARDQRDGALHLEGGWREINVVCLEGGWREINVVCLEHATPMWHTQITSRVNSEQRWPSRSFLAHLRDHRPFFEKHKPIPEHHRPIEESQAISKHHMPF